MIFAVLEDSYHYNVFTQSFKLVSFFYIYSKNNAIECQIVKLQFLLSFFFKMLNLTYLVLNNFNVTFSMNQKIYW